MLFSFGENEIILHKHAGSNVKMIQKYIYCWFVYTTQSAVLLRDAIGHLIQLMFTTYSTRRNMQSRSIRCFSVSLFCGRNKIHRSKYKITNQLMSRDITTSQNRLFLFVGLFVNFNNDLKHIKYEIVFTLHDVATSPNMILRSNFRYLRD